MRKIPGILGVLVRRMSFRKISGKLWGVCGCGSLNFVCGNLRDLYWFGLFNTIIIGLEETLLSARKRSLLGAIIAFNEDMIFKLYYFYLNNSIIVVVLLYCFFIIDKFCFWKGIWSDGLVVLCAWGLAFKTRNSKVDLLAIFKAKHAIRTLGWNSFWFLFYILLFVVIMDLEVGKDIAEWYLRHFVMRTL